MELRSDPSRLALDARLGATLLHGVVADSQAWHGCSSVIKDRGSFYLSVQPSLTVAFLLHDSGWLQKHHSHQGRHHIQVPKMQTSQPGHVFEKALPETPRHTSTYSLWSEPLHMAELSRKRGHPEEHQLSSAGSEGRMETGWEARSLLCCSCPS